MVCAVADENYTEAVKRAEGIVEASNVDDALTVAAFQLALYCLLVNIEGERRSATREERQEGNSQDNDAYPTALGQKSGVSPSLVSEFFEFGDDGFEIVMPSSKFASSKTAGAKQLALLVAAG